MRHCAAMKTRIMLTILLTVLLTISCFYPMQCKLIIALAFMHVQEHLDAGGFVRHAIMLPVPHGHHSLGRRAVLIPVVLDDLYHLDVEHFDVVQLLRGHSGVGVSRSVVLVLMGISIDCFCPSANMGTTA